MVFIKFFEGFLNSQIIVICGDSPLNHIKVFHDFEESFVRLLVDKAELLQFCVRDEIDFKIDQFKILICMPNNKAYPLTSSIVLFPHFTSHNGRHVPVSVGHSPSGISKVLLDTSTNPQFCILSCNLSVNVKSSPISSHWLEKKSSNACSTGPGLWWIRSTNVVVRSKEYW